MKIIKLTIALITMLALFSPTAVSAKGGKKNQPSSSVSVLTQDEEDTLLWMREEEKLARDVYLTLYDIWEQAIFNNIAGSEQNHMDAMLKKIDSFGLTDPVVEGIGNFSNDTLDALYNQLTSDGELSYIDALIVGATIEDLDIKDLMDAIEATDDLALKTTYESLLEASKNHLRAFVGQLTQLGVNYTPVYITQDLFEAILDI